MGRGQHPILNNAASRSRQGPPDFQSVFRTTYGERWQNLYASLLEDTEHVAMANPFALSSHFDSSTWQAVDAVSLDPLQASILQVPVVAIEAADTALTNLCASAVLQGCRSFKTLLAANS